MSGAGMRRGKFTDAGGAESAGDEGCGNGVVTGILDDFGRKGLNVHD